MRSYGKDAVATGCRSPLVSSLLPFFITIAPSPAIASLNNASLGQRFSRSPVSVREGLVRGNWRGVNSAPTYGNRGGAVKEYVGF
jgi:hypothetical protein